MVARRRLKRPPRRSAHLSTQRKHVTLAQAAAKDSVVHRVDEDVKTMRDEIKREDDRDKRAKETGGGSTGKANMVGGKNLGLGQGGVGMGLSPAAGLGSAMAGIEGAIEEDEEKSNSGSEGDDETEEEKPGRSPSSARRIGVKVAGDED
jgi:hypothetical protein